MWIPSSHQMRPLSFIARSSPSSLSGRDLRWVAYWLLVGFFVVVVASEKSSQAAPPHSSAVHMALGEGSWQQPHWALSSGEAGLILTLDLFLSGKTVLLFIKVIGTQFNSSYESKYSFPKKNSKQFRSSLSLILSRCKIRFLQFLGPKIMMMFFSLPVSECFWNTEALEKGEWQAKTNFSHIKGWDSKEKP